MGMSAEDRFLDCVLRRAGKDISINPLVLLLIIPGSLSFIVLLIIRLYIESGVWFGFSDAGEYLIALFFSMDAAFITYVLMKSIKLHTDRTIVWTDALCEFVEDNDKDSRELRLLADDVASQRIVWGRMVSFLIFAAMVAMMALSFFILDFRSGSGDGQFKTPEIIVLGIAAANLCITSLFGVYKLNKIDDILCRFTELLKGTFDSKGFPEPMKPSTMKNKVEIQVALIVISLVLTTVLRFSIRYANGLGFNIPEVNPILMVVGLYLSFLFFYVIHILNRHIRHLWEYENKLLAWMAIHVGADRIERIPIEEKRERPAGQGKISFMLSELIRQTKRWFKEYFDLI
jgi:hypothetical protein